MRGRHLTPVGAIVLIVVPVGLVLVIVGSEGLKIVGALAVLLAVVAVAGGRLADGLRGTGTGRGRRTRRVTYREPDYIAEAGTPSEDVWAREEARYRERNDPPA